MNQNAKLEHEAQLQFDEFIRQVPREHMWPAVVGLLQHLLLHDDVSLDDYAYGVFAVTDTLRDAAFKLQERGLGELGTDITLLTQLRSGKLP